MTMNIDSQQAKALWPPTCHGRWMDEAYEPGLVSVIVPTYNRAHFLGEAMDSVWAQTYRPIEMIVVDDGSTDNTNDVLERWRDDHARDPQFTLRTFHQPNRGAPAARNLGLIESRGEFIQFLDCDDVLATTKIAQQVLTLLADRSLDAIYSPCCMFSVVRGGVKVDRMRIPDLHPDPLARWLAGRYAPVHSLLWKRRVALVSGPWDEQLAADQDGEYAMRCLILASAKLTFCLSGVAFYRNHQGTRLSTTPMTLISRMRVAEKMELALLSGAQGSVSLRGSRVRALGSRFYLLGYNELYLNRELAQRCLSKWRQLCPEGHRCGRSRMHVFLTRVFGIHVARCLSAFRYRAVACIGRAKPHALFRDTCEMCQDRRYTHCQE